MKNEFKVGDKVRVTNCSIKGIIGEVGVVAEVCCGGVEVRFDKNITPRGNIWWLHADRVEKVQNEAEIKVGDRVSVLFGEKRRKGTVIGFCGRDITVEFDEPMGGHTGGMCGKTGKDGHCWHCLKKNVELLKDDEVIFNGKKTVLIKDGKKYISECKDGDTYDKEKGLLLCLAQANGISYKDLREMIAGAKDCNAAKVKRFNVGDRVMAKTHWGCDGQIGTIVKKDNSNIPYLVEFDDKVEYWLAENEVFHVEKTDDKPQVREVKREAKVGEYIKIVAAAATSGCYGNGDIFKVYKLHNDERGKGVYCDMPKKASSVCVNDNGNLVIWNKEYVVLENYTPYKITLSEFWNRKDNLAIHCKTEDEAKELLKAFDKAGERWRSGASYLKKSYWNDDKEKTLYTNDNACGNIDDAWVKYEKYTIYEFNEVDLEN